MTAEPVAPGPMSGKVVLITGGTGGIGKATAMGPASNKASYDAIAANRLWQVSADLIGLTAA